MREVSVLLVSQKYLYSHSFTIADVFLRFLGMVGEMVVFEAGDVTAGGYLALPEGTGPGVMVIQEWWGFHRGRTRSNHDSLKQV